MGNMIMGDIMQEIAAHPAKQRTIDRACRTAKEIPCTLAEVWEGRIRMLQLRQENSYFDFYGFVWMFTYEDECDNPMIREGVWDDVHTHEIGERGKVGIIPKSRHNSRDTNTGHDNTKARGFTNDNYVITTPDESFLD